jgi:polyisoprenoid-binding protein YceI
MWFVMALLSAVPVAMAQKNVWTLDKAHSEVTFSVAHMAISDVTGEFKDYDVILNSSQEDFSDASVKAVLNVSSIDTDIERRDNHLKSQDFFYAEKYPTISFSSTEFKATGPNTYDVTGDLTIRDVTRKVTFKAEHRGTIESNGKIRSGWRATITINRFDYDIHWSKVLETGGLVAGKMVDIVLKLEFQKDVSS